MHSVSISHCFAISSSTIAIENTSLEMYLELTVSSWEWYTVSEAVTIYQPIQLQFATQYSRAARLNGLEQKSIASTEAITIRWKRKTFNLKSAQHVQQKATPAHPSPNGPDQFRARLDHHHFA